MGVGRYICVALPFILTLASIICMLIAGLAGVTNNSLYLFRVDVTNLSVDAATIQDLVNTVSGITSREAAPDWTDSALDNLGISDEQTDASTASDIASAAAENTITAEQLGLANLYDFSLWGYCQTSQNDTKTCTKAKFNWAETELSTEWLDTFNTLAGINIEIPSELEDGLTLFKTVSRWTQIVYIIAMVALGLELFIGLFSACSRAVSCLVWLISGFATAAVIAAAAMMTAMASVVVGTVEGVASQYDVKGSFNNSFLATIWIGVAFAVGASLFWLFSACCCKSENRSHAKKSKYADNTEKFIPTGSYAPLGESHNRNTGYNYGIPQRGGARSDLAYEPYSHSHSHV